MRRNKIQKGEMILDKLYSVQLYDYYDTRCYDPIRVLGSSHFNGFLIANVGSKLIFNLQNKEGSVIIPFENIKWMVPIKEEEKKEERDWLDDL
jgi:hypothetical protein